MLIGTVLILCGVLLALYPPLPALIVSAVLVLQGALCIALAIGYRRAGASHRVRVVDVILRR